MPGREATMRRILAEGDEIGDHTMNHVEYPGYAQIAGAAERIKAYTGFQPCLFRPPGGAVELERDRDRRLARDEDDHLGRRSARLVAAGHLARSIPTSSTTRNPGRSSSCTTAAAPATRPSPRCPEIIDTLRARGYGFETVSALLGDEMLYRPYG